MKKQFFCALFAAMSIMAFGQSDLNQNWSCHPILVDTILRSLPPKVNTSVDKNISFRSTAMKQRNDSLLSALARDVYTYDAKNNCIQDIYYTRTNISSPWIPNVLYQMEYDVNGNKTLVSTSYWNSTNVSWDYSSKTEYTYNSNNKKTSETVSSWSTNWNPAARYQYTYDSDGFCTQKVYSRYDSYTTFSWINYDRYDYINNVAGKCTKMNTYSYGTSTWILKYSNDYTLDANGNITKDSCSQNTVDGWIPSAVKSYVFDAQNNNTQVITSIWSAASSSLVNSTKFDYTFDANNNCTQQKYYSWNKTSSSWVPSDMYSYTYDTYNNQTQEIYYYYVSPNYEYRTKRNYTYNTSYYYTNVIFPWGSEVRYKYMLTSVADSTWDKTNLIWTSTQLNTLYYNSISAAGVKEDVNSNVKVFVQDGKLVIEGLLGDNSISVYTITGIYVYNQTGNDAIKLNLPERGIYVVKIGNQSIKVVN